MTKTVSFKKFRSWLFLLISLFVFVYFFFIQMQIQIVDADMYTAMVQGKTVSTQPIKAVRGEILDRNGKPLVQNELSYNVVFDRAFLPYDRQSEIIFQLTLLFEQSGHSWIDTLPISPTTPFTYLPDKTADVAVLKEKKGAQAYTTADDLMFWLTEEYSLQGYSLVDARKIAGILYEMENKKFSIHNPYVFATQVENPLIITIKERSINLPGVDILSTAVRVYPNESLAPHILGMTGPLYREEYDQLKADGLIFNRRQEPYDTRGYTLDDTLGKGGIEKSMENYLRGYNGLREIQMDRYGMAVGAEEVISPQAGNNIVLTIDMDMQLLLDESLEAQIKHLNQTQPEGRGGEAHSGAAVVLNAKTGEVLASSTYPSYSISDYKSNYQEVAGRHGSPLISRSIQGQYTPGSIYKPVVALAGLNNGIITPNTHFYCSGTYTFYAPYTPKCLGSHGSIGVNNALAWSCNIFFYDTGRLTGIDSIDETAKALGLGEPTGIEIDEALGQRSNPEVKITRGGGDWYGADTIQSAIGQLDNQFSPLQLANFAATIGNRGRRMELTLVREVRDFTMQEAIVPFTPKVAYEMSDYSQENFEVVINGMKGAMTGSAGGTFSGYPVQAACKTGTPQVTEDIVNSTFIIFAPADDPEIAIAVVVEEGWQGYTGAPVAKAVMDDYFGVDHRGAVASGPQRLEDFRSENPTVTDPREVMNAVFPEFSNGITAEETNAIV